MSTDTDTYTTPWAMAEEERLRAVQGGEWWRTRTTWLDTKRPAPPTLDYLLGRAISALALLADGAVASLKADKVTEGEREPGVPTSTLARIVTQLEREYGAARTNRQRLLVIRAAQRMMPILGGLKVDRRRVQGTPEWYRAIATDPRSQRKIAAEYGISQVAVCKIKRRMKALDAPPAEGDN